MAWLQARTRLRLLLKGLLHPDNARQASALGVAGLIVSNHGGRTLDTSSVTADALPRVPTLWPAGPGWHPRCWSKAASAAAPMCSGPSR